MPVTTPAPTAATVSGRTRRLQRGLLAWYDADARGLPWRGGDPWRVLVSEVMAQQTQADRVVTAWAAFCARFPTPTALADAAPADAIALWAGLGYNRRAINLHRAAVAIRDEHAGQVPADLDALLALPGVGPYTARAVLAFAHGLDTAPVDTNVARVLARALAGASLGRAAAQALAEEVAPVGQAADWSQALMDLGARICTSRSPRCAACPIAATCAWQSNGGDDPAAANAVRARPQGRFRGSDREHRGRLVDALRRGPIPVDGLAAASGCDDRDRLVRITEGVVDDGLAEWSEGALRLPGAP